MNPQRREANRTGAGAHTSSGPPTYPSRLLRLLPAPIRARIYYRFYRSNRSLDPAYYHHVPLHFAPGCSMTLLPTDEAHGCIAYTGLYEYRISRLMRSRSLAGGGLMVDVGANFGYHAILWASQRVDSSVVAIEASPRNRIALEGNLRANHLVPRVTILPVAAGRASGTMPFNLGPEAQTGWGGLAKGMSPGSIDVTVQRLDDVLSRSMAIRFLKIDTEGADTWVLEGAGGLLASGCIEEIILEVNPPRMKELGIEPGRAREILQDCGYVIRAIGGPEGGMHDVHAKRKALQSL